MPKRKGGEEVVSSPSVESEKKKQKKAAKKEKKEKKIAKKKKEEDPSVASGNAAAATAADGSVPSTARVTTMIGADDSKKDEEYHEKGSAKKEKKKKKRKHEKELDASSADALAAEENSPVSSSQIKPNHDAGDPVKVIEFPVVISVLPHCLRNIRVAVRESLNGRLLKFDPRFGGVPIKFSKAQIVQKSGQIVGGEPQVHVRVRATARVFAPKPGMVLTGCVQKVAPKHVALLTHEIFNATCSISPPGAESATTPKLTTGAIVRFRVLSLAFSEGLLSIMGELLH